MLQKAMRDYRGRAALEIWHPRCVDYVNNHSWQHARGKHRREDVLGNQTRAEHANVPRAAAATARAAAATC